MSAVRLIVDTHATLADWLRPDLVAAVRKRSYSGRCAEICVPFHWFENPDRLLPDAFQLDTMSRDQFTVLQETNLPLSM